MANSKKRYIAPEVEIDVFETEDILTLSNLGNSMTGSGNISYSSGGGTYNNAGSNTYANIFDFSE